MTWPDQLRDMRERHSLNRFKRSLSEFMKRFKCGGKIRPFGDHDAQRIRQRRHNQPFPVECSSRRWHHGVVGGAPRREAEPIVAPVQVSRFRSGRDCHFGRPLLRVAASGPLLGLFVLNLADWIVTRRLRRRVKRISVSRFD
jgi:hypothetical protein